MIDAFPLLHKTADYNLYCYFVRTRFHFYLIVKADVFYESVHNDNTFYAI